MEIKSDEAEHARLQQAFDQFRTDPAERFRIELRRRRSAEVRDLLANPSKIDLDTFNREVWRFNDSVKLHGQEIGHEIYDTLDLSTARIAELSEALNHNDLEMHGNLIWGTSTYVFGAQLKRSPEEKLECIRKALAHFNDDTLSPTEKVDKIVSVPGFGNNIATGLVMVRHPADFAIWNKPSKEGMRRLGYPQHNLEVFQNSVSDLRNRLGAEDFIELDWFLFQLVNGQIPYELTDVSDPSVQYWVIALGEGARLWPQCRDESMIAIGWEFLGDLRVYESKQVIEEAMESHYQSGKRHVNDTTACYEFCHVMEKGDHVFAKQGRTGLLGYGIVQSDYQYDQERSEYHHIRRVDWKTTGKWELPEGVRLPIKTLTNVTNYRAFLNYALPMVKTGHVGIIDHQEVGAYTLSDALNGLFMTKEEFQEMLDALGRKKNVILQGPPGVGKTFVARRLAYALLGVKNNAKIQMVQFHQSYSYEDFIQGYRPKEDGGFELRNGVFYEFCELARNDLSSDYVFIIDEINRGNLSKVFGELLMLIEADKRGEGFAIPLTYSSPGGTHFSVPENVHILGMMNTADRSLAMVDYALRRRFTFVDLKPRFESEAFREFLKGSVDDDLIDLIVDRFTKLNQVICSDKVNLGPGFQVGHSFFCPQETEQDLDREWYESVVRREIAPLLREYWFDASEKAEEQIEQLLK